VNFGAKNSKTNRISLKESAAADGDATTRERKITEQKYIGREEETAKIAQKLEKSLGAENEQKWAKIRTKQKKHKKFDR
jgi:hypothetical protein